MKPMYYAVSKVIQKIIYAYALPERARASFNWMYYSFIRLIKYGTNDFFFGVEIETITACNRRCSHCPNSEYNRGLIKNKRIMSIKLIRKIITELAEIEFCGRFLPHFYGEPLLDKRMPYIIKYARKKLPQANLIISTNGDFLTVELYKKLVRAGIDGFIITQHSQNKPKNVDKVLQYRKNFGKDNVIIDYRSINTIRLFNRAGIISLKDSKKIVKCNLVSDNIMIDFQGNVILCCNDYFSTIKLGNITREKLIDIWNKSRYRRIREDLRRGSLHLKICSKCESGYKLSTHIAS